MASHPDYPRTRLFVEHTLHPDASFASTREQAHYLHHVLRLKAGDAMALFNGRDGEWLAHITYVDKASVGFRVDSPLRAQKAVPQVGLIFAPLKGGKTETVVEKATELGAAWIQAAFTTHTVVTRLHEERLQKIALEAAEQCERLDVPEVRKTRKLEEILQNLGERILLYCDESGRGENPVVLLPNIIKLAAASRVREAPARSTGVYTEIHEDVSTGATKQMAAAVEFVLLVGPEGGFSTKELELLRALPNAHALSLGPRILKADTAAITALACLMEHAGDWDEKPSFRTI